MSPLTGQASIAAVDPGELDSLLSAISDAVEALAAWNVPRFQSAVERQSAICLRLADHSDWRGLHSATATARKIFDLNRLYAKLLQHSIHWTRVLRTILDPGGNPISSRTTMDLRG